MAVFDKLLIPTDFSEHADKALLLAEKIASYCSAQSDLIHVIPHVIFQDEQNREGEEGLEDARNQVYPLLFNEAELSLNKRIKENFPASVRGQYYVKVDSRPSRVICDHAWSGNYSLIIMSARGKDESGYFRGSTTEAVVRASNVPVLSLYSDPVVLENGRIVLPVDGSLLSLAALPAASTIASLFGATITLLYIVQPLGFLRSPFSSELSGSDADQIKVSLLNRIREYFDDYAPSGLTLSENDGGDNPQDSPAFNLITENQMLPVNFEIRSSLSIHNEITSYANNSAELVVMSTHGRSGIQHLMMGSNAEKVALNAKTSVLTIRPDSKLFSHQQTSPPS